MYYSARQYGRSSGGGKKKWILFILLPLLIVGLSAGIFFVLKSFFFNDIGYFRGVEYVPEDSVGYVQFKNAEQWNKFQRTLTINEGESVRSAAGKNLHLDFFNGTKIYLDTGAEIKIEKSSEVNNGEMFAIVRLQSGSIWAEIKTQTEKDANFRIVLSDTLHIESKGGIVVITPSAVRVLGEGSSSAEITAMDESGKISFSKKISVGQEIAISPDSLSEAITKRMFSLSSIDPDFYTDEFYLARIPDNLLIVPSPSVVVSPSPDTSEQGGLLLVPEITTPGKTGESVKVDQNSVYIKGTAPEGTQKIYVNDYALSKFSPGDTTWTYLASTSLDNLSKGENLFTVVAEGENGEKSKPATITLLYSGVGSVATIGTLKITSPNNGQDTNISTRNISLSGTAPSNAAFIQVNDYFLKKFKQGDSTWSYIENELKSGETIFTVNALDAQKRFLASDKIIITVDTGANTPTPVAIASPEPTILVTPTPHSSTFEIQR
jgi:hypothetical protein